MEDNPYASTTTPSRDDKPNTAAKIGFAIAVLGLVSLLVTNGLYYYTDGSFIDYLQGEREVFAPLLLFPVGLSFSVAGLFRTPRRLAIVGLLLNALGSLNVQSYVMRCLLE